MSAKKEEKQAVIKIEDGVEYSDYPDHVIFRVMKKSIGKSASGKTDFYANTHGWKNIENGLTVNIMIGTSTKTAKKGSKVVGKISMK